MKTQTPQTKIETAEIESEYMQICLTIFYGICVLIISHELIFYILPLNYLMFHIVPGCHDLRMNERQVYIVLRDIKAMYEDFYLKPIKINDLIEITNLPKDIILIILNIYLPNYFNDTTLNQKKMINFNYFEHYLLSQFNCDCSNNNNINKDGILLHSIDCHSDQMIVQTQYNYENKPFYLLFDISHPIEGDDESLIVEEL